MRGLKMARVSPFGKGAGTGMKRSRRNERTRRLFLFEDILLLAVIHDILALRGIDQQLGALQ